MNSDVSSRIWLKDVAGNLEPGFFLLSTKQIYLMDHLYLVKHRVREKEIRNEMQKLVFPLRYVLKLKNTFRVSSKNHSGSSG